MRSSDEYDVFTPQANERADRGVRAVKRAATPVHVWPISVAARERLRNCCGGEGIKVSASISAPNWWQLGRRKYPGLELIEGDAENLPFESASLDGVLLSGLVHHFPDPRRLAGEVKRVLRNGGRFVAFDPNRMNPVHVALSRSRIALL